MANKTSQDALLRDQGARPTQKSENQRAAIVDAVGEVHATEDSENKRIATVVR